MIPFYSNEDVRGFIYDIRSRLAMVSDDINDSIALAEIEKYVFSKPGSHSAGYKANRELIQKIFFSLRKEMDILQPLVDDAGISEIMVNGKDDIFVERKGRVSRVPLSFDSTEDLEELIRRISARVHREINELNPIVDARLSDGSRVNAVYGNIALNGPILTIRKFPERVMTIDDLIKNETISEEAARMLDCLVFCGYNIFISGGTSSGKTTLLNVLAQMIPHDERVVVIEDSAELQIKQVDNIVRMECRNANVQGKGAVDMSQLVKTSLRMRPDRIVIGEVRGSEVFDMINAMNTGHSGSLSTGHANSISGMLKRLESMFMQAVDFPVDAIRSQICEGIDVIVHMSRMKNGSRKIIEIAEIDRVENGVIMTNQLYDHNSGLTGNRLSHREKIETMNGRSGNKADRIADDIRLLKI